MKALAITAGIVFWTLVLGIAWLAFFREASRADPWLFCKSSGLRPLARVKLLRVLPPRPSRRRLRHQKRPRSQLQRTLPLQPKLSHRLLARKPPVPT